MRRLTLFRTSFLFLGIACLLPMEVQGQGIYFRPDQPNEPLDPFALEGTLPEGIFDEESLLEVRLESDFTHLEATKEVEAYQPASLQVKYREDLYFRCPVRIKARGQSRKRYCDYPPFFLNFKKSDLERSEWAQLSKVKVVPQCHPHRTYENYLLREYLAYKLYHLLNPYSFRVRLARFTYVDTGQSGESWEEFAFLIEEEEMLGFRLGMEEVDRPKDKLARLDTTALTLLSLSQYVLGNVDWHVLSGHNIKYYQRPRAEEAPIHTVGYDFDLSGLVNPVYGKPLAALDMETVRDRKYLGCPWSEEVLARSIRDLLEKQEAVEQAIRDFSYLPAAERNDVLRYVRSGFRILSNPKKMQKFLEEKCFPYAW